MKTIRYELDGAGIATLTFDQPDSPVNTMTPQWRLDLAAAALQLLADKERIKCVLLASAKTTFFAGVDLKSLLKLTDDDARQGFAEIEAMKRDFRRIEPPGWITARMPAFAAASMPSRKGKNASDAITDPATCRLACCAFQPAISALTTRLI